MPHLNLPSRPTLTRAISALIFISLVLAFTVSQAKAQVVASVSLLSGRNAVAFTHVNVHNSLRVEATIYSVVRGGSDNSFARRKMTMELLNPSGQVVASLTAGI